LEVVETEPLNDNFELFDIGNKNFLFNSGSYFIIFIGILIFNIGLYIANMIARCFARKKCCRKVGMLVHSKSRCLGIINEIIKLFIESYFDISICVLLHTISFYEKNEEGIQLISLMTEYATDIVVLCLYSIHALLIPITPFVSFYLIRSNFANLDRPKIQARYEMLLEGKSSDIYSALYTAYFMFRRLFSAAVLVILNAWPFFQCNALLVLSTLNMNYLIGTLPLKTRYDNRNELFNEFCIMVVTQVMTICLNVGFPIEIIDILGWSLIFVTSFNIIGNLFVVGRNSIENMYDSC